MAKINDKRLKYYKRLAYKHFVMEVLEITDNAFNLLVSRGKINIDEPITIIDYINKKRHLLSKKI